MQHLQQQILLLTNKNKSMKHLIIKAIVAGLIAALSVIAAGIGLTSCHAVRNVTTTAETYQKGDTSVIIQTKTIESYTASKQN